jgi:hypothetical protein
MLLVVFKTPNKSQILLGKKKEKLIKSKLKKK